MAENQQQPKISEKRQKRIDLWAAGVFTALGISFLIYDLKIVVIDQHGRFDLSDKVLMPVSFLMVAIAIISLVLIHRERLALGAELLYYGFVIAGPVLAILLLNGVLLVIVFYIMVLAIIMITWILPASSRTRSIISAAAAVGICLIIEAINPGFRVSTNFGSFAAPITIVTALAILAFLIRQFPSLSLRTKVIMALVGITVITVAALASYLLNEIYQNAYNTAATQITTSNQEHIQSIQTFLSDHSRDVLILSQLPDLTNLIAAEQTNADPAEISVYTNQLNKDFQVFFDSHPVYDNIRFINANGQEVTKVTSLYISATLQNKANRPFFSVPAKMPAGSLYISPLELEQDLGVIIVPHRPVLRFATPVYYNNRLAGVIVANALAENFLNVLADRNHHVMLVDKNGYYLFDSQIYNADISLNKLFGGTNDLNTGYTVVKDFPGNAATLLSSASGTTIDQGNVYFHEPVTVLNEKTPRWFLIYAIPQSEIYATANRLLINSLLILGLILFIAIAVAVYLGNSLTSPLINLTKIAREAGTGNLSVRSDIKVNDEIGSLAATFNLMIDQLGRQIQTLDERVADRTEELETQAQRVRWAAEIARDISSAPNLNELLMRSSSLIIDRFHFYHAGIFLLDEKREFAILRASPTEAGKQLLANNHRLRVGEQGIVGRVAESGTARIALDTGADAVYFNNPFLPNTRSEMALPLKTRNEVFGVIDIQSDQPQAFVQEDIEILQILADQLAIAIERVELLEQSKNQLQETERAYQEYTQTSWRSFVQNEKRIAGYRFDGAQLRPIYESADEIKSLSQTAPNEAGGRSIPIRLRGQTIGFVNLRSRNSQISNETVAIVEQISERLASSLENARLSEETRQRADRERAIAEISGKIGSAYNIDDILRSMTEELGKMFDDSEIAVQLTKEE